MRIEEMELVVNGSPFGKFGLRYKRLDTFDENNFVRVRMGPINKPQEYMVHTFVHPQDYIDGIGAGYHLVLVTNDRADKWMLLSQKEDVFLFFAVPEVDKSNEGHQWYSLHEVVSEFENRLNSRYRELENKLKLLRQPCVFLGHAQNGTYL